MEARYAAGMAVVQELTTHQATSKLAVSDRETLFDSLKPLMTRVHNLVKASGAPASVIEDLSSSKRKLAGASKSSKAKPDAAAGDAKPGTGANVPAKTRSSAQTSYENLIGHFSGYLAVLQNISDYNPNEADLKLAALLTFRDTLQAKNDAVSAASVLVSQARGPNAMNCSIRARTRS